MPRRPAPPKVESMSTSVSMKDTNKPDVPKVPEPTGQKQITPSQSIKKIMDGMKAVRQPWNYPYQAVAELVDCNNTRDFSGSNPLSNLTEDFRWDNVFESTPAMAAQTCGAAFAGMLLPDGARSAKVTLKHEKAINDKESKEWMERSNRKYVSALDDPRANLMNAVGEYWDDNVKYGTTSITRVPGRGGPDEPVFRFDTWNVANFWIKEGPGRKVDTLAITWPRTADELVKSFGYSNCAKEVRDSYDTQDFSKTFDYVHLIQPRLDRDPSKKGVMNAPIMSQHWDLTNDKLMKESGFNRRSFYVGRFYLRPGQLYAYSPAMNALPDAYLANAVKEAIILATEKMLDPPMGTFSADTLGNSTFDTSAGEFNVFESPPAGWQGPPVFQMQTIGDPRTAAALLEQLIESIKNHFFLDRLLDLNNAVQMTAREALIRDAIRSTTLRTPIQRALSDVYTPIFQDSWDDMLDWGMFGVRQGSVVHRNMLAQGIEPEDEIPQVIQELLDAGEQVFEVVFNNAASRDARAAEAQAIVDQIGLVANVTPAYPQARNEMNIMKALDRIAEARGVPIDILNTADERAAIEKVQNAQEQEKAVLANLGAVAGISKNLGMVPNGQPQ